MIDLLHTVTGLAALRPADLPAIDLPAGPDLAALLPLAHYLGTNPAPLLTLAEQLLGDQGTIAEVLRQAQPLITAAQGDIAGIATRFLAQAAPLLPQLFLPSTQLQLGALGAQAAAEANARVHHLIAELTPLATRLDQIAEPSIALTGTSEDAPLSPGGTSSGEAAVAAAKSALGTPYAWGGTSLAGFDCSGLTQWAWRQAGVELPRLAEEQSVGRPVSAAELAPGDLAVWDGHVAMYAGDGQLIEAGDPVQLNPLRTTNMGMAFQGFYRPTG